MKTRAFLFISIFLFTVSGVSLANETIKGNKNIVTKTVAISDYDEISVAGQMEFTYEQSNASPYLEITIDENIFPYVRIEVEGSRLIVGPKQQNDNQSYTLKPTVYKIKTNSKELRRLNKAGSGNFIVASPIKTSFLAISSAGSGTVEFMKEATCDEMKISMAGSGDVLARGAFTINKADVSMAGSGNIKLMKQLIAEDVKLSLAGSGNLLASGITAETLHCSLSSSGEIKVDGTAKELSCSIAGSGKIKAYGCKANDVKSSITGSGAIELYAIDQLSANVMGSGEISYKGNPSLQSNKKGSGKIRQVN